MRWRNNTWKDAIVVRKAEEPRSYMIKTQDGIYRRNRVHIRPRMVPVDDILETDIQSEERMTIEEPQTDEAENIGRNVEPRRNTKPPGKYKDYECKFYGRRT